MKIQTNDIYRYQRLSMVSVFICFCLRPHLLSTVFFFTTINNLRKLEKERYLGKLSVKVIIGPLLSSLLAIKNSLHFFINFFFFFFKALSLSVSSKTELQAIITCRAAQTCFFSECFNFFGSYPRNTKKFKCAS